MSTTSCIRKTALLAGQITLIANSKATAQIATPATKMANVEGRTMRVAVAGLQQRKLGQAVIILGQGAQQDRIDDAEHNRAGTIPSARVSTATTVKRGSADRASLTLEPAARVLSDLLIEMKP